MSVGVHVGVLVAVSVGVFVGVWVGEGVLVGTGVSVIVGVSVGVLVSVGVWVIVGVLVVVAVFVGDGVFVGVGVGVGHSSTMAWPLMFSESTPVMEISRRAVGPTNEPQSSATPSPVRSRMSRSSLPISVKSKPLYVTATTMAA